MTLHLPMPVRRVVADERVVDDRGRIALERGPFVYAVEGVDHGGTVLDLTVPDGARLEVERRPDLLGGVTVITGSVADATWTPPCAHRDSVLAWSHRGPGEMAVWLRRARPQ